MTGDYRATLSPPMAWRGLVVRSRGLDFLRRRTAERADHVQDDFRHRGGRLRGCMARFA